MKYEVVQKKLEGIQSMQNNGDNKSWEKHETHQTFNNGNAVAWRV